MSRRQLVINVFLTLTAAVCLSCGSDTNRTDGVGGSDAAAQAGRDGQAGSAGQGGTAGSAGQGGEATGGAGQGGIAGSAGQGGEATGGGGQGGNAGQGGGSLPTGELEIGMWCGPPREHLTKERFNQIVEAGFTTVAPACSVAEIGNTSTYMHQMLSLANSVGIKGYITGGGLSALFAMEHRGEVVTDEKLKETITKYVTEYKGEPGLLAYRLDDEPTKKRFPLLGRLTAEIARQDPAHYGFIDIFPNYASPDQLGTNTYDEHVSSFLEIVKPKVFAFNHYNFFKNGDREIYFSNLEVVRKYAVKNGIPFGMYIQAYSDNNLRLPNGPEKLWAGLNVLVYGGHAVSYFRYWANDSKTGLTGIITKDGEKTKQFNEVKANNKVLKTIGKYLVKASSTKVFHNGPLPVGTQPRAPGDLVYIPNSNDSLIVGLFSVNKDNAYALIVNGKHNKETISSIIFAVANGDLRGLNTDTDKFVPITGAVSVPEGTRVRIKFAPGSGTLFHLRNPYPKGPDGVGG